MLGMSKGIMGSWFLVLETWIWVSHSGFWVQGAEFLDLGKFLVLSSWF